jgi:hypothetical protein
MTSHQYCIYLYLYQLYLYYMHYILIDNHISISYIYISLSIYIPQPALYLYYVHIYNHISISYIYISMSIYIYIYRNRARDFQYIWCETCRKRCPTEVSKRKKEKMLRVALRRRNKTDYIELANGFP